MDLVRDVLDKQIVDRDEARMGKVDGLVIRLRKGAPPKLVRIEMGPDVLARRIGPRLGSWAAGLRVRLGGEKHRRPFRVPWTRVRDVGRDVEVDLRTTSMHGLQDWLRRNVVGRIPGGRS